MEVLIVLKSLLNLQVSIILLYLRQTGSELPLVREMVLALHLQLGHRVLQVLQLYQDL